MGCSGSKGTQSSLGNQEASRGGTLLLDSDATSDGENQQRKGSVIHKAPEFTVSAAVGSPFDTSVHRHTHAARNRASADAHGGIDLESKNQSGSRDVLLPVQRHT